MKEHKNQAHNKEAKWCIFFLFSHKLITKPAPDEASDVLFNARNVEAHLK